MHATNGAAVVDYKSRAALNLDPGLQQESSSQSSSADNGDPQTPSPLYTEAVVNHTTSDVPAEDVVASALKSELIDPQLARLLSALTTSAKTDMENPSKPLSDPAILSIGKVEVQTPEKTPRATGQRYRRAILCTYRISVGRESPRSFPSSYLIISLAGAGHTCISDSIAPSLEGLYALPETGTTEWPSISQGFSCASSYLSSSFRCVVIDNLDVISIPPHGSSGFVCHHRSHAVHQSSSRRP